MYIWACIVVICRFWICTVKDGGNWLLLFKNDARRDFLTRGFNGNSIFGPREDKSGTAVFCMNLIWRLSLSPCSKRTVAHVQAVLSTESRN